MNPGLAKPLGRFGVLQPVKQKQMLQPLMQQAFASTMHLHGQRVGLICGVGEEFSHSSLGECACFMIICQTVVIGSLVRVIVSYLLHLLNVFQICFEDARCAMHAVGTHLQVLHLLPQCLDKKNPSGKLTKLCSMDVAAGKGKKVKAELTLAELQSAGCLCRCRMQLQV